MELEIKSFNTMRGLEPIIVRVPPRIAQKPIGISSLDRGIPVRVEMRLTAGRNRAAVPMACMKLATSPATPEIIGMTRRSLLPATRRMYETRWVITPVRSSPAPMIMSAMIEMTALLAKPSNIRSAGTMPATPSTTSTVTAARSTRTTSNTNR